MASALSTPVTALQVGTYFVRQYYHVLQQQPQFVHQFYTDVSTMQRMDRDNQETATGMMEIHKCVMSLNYTGSVIEIKSADAQHSLNGGVLVMVTGSIQRKDEFRKNFVQTFFLAPQDKGFYVLNDIFRYNDDDRYQQNQVEFTENGDHESQLMSSSPLPDSVPEPVPSVAEGQREITSTAVEEETVIEQGGDTDHQEIPVIEDHFEKIPNEIPVSVTSSAPTPEVSESPALVQENTGEPTKQTYASILRASKGPSVVAPVHQIPSAKPVPVTSERQPSSQPSQQHINTLPATEEMHKSSTDDFAVSESEGDGRSIYVRNLPSTVTSSQLELEFKTFGNIRAGGVKVFSRKEAGTCYAFIDFEDSGSVQSAVAASPLAFSGRQIHIEERRNNSSGARGRRGGRGRMFQNDGTRGRGFGARGFGRSGVDAGRMYNNSGRGAGGRGTFGGGSGNSRQPRRVGVNQQNGAA